MTKLEDLKTRWMKDPQFKADYDALDKPLPVPSPQSDAAPALSENTHPDRATDRRQKG